MHRCHPLRFSNEIQTATLHQGAEVWNRPDFPLAYSRRGHINEIPLFVVFLIWQRYGVAFLRERIDHTTEGSQEIIMKIFVGNLTPHVTDEDLRQQFQAFGTVDSVEVIKDRFRDVSRGFAFVEMSVKEEAEAAIAGLKGKQLHGRSMDVLEARPREQRRSGGGKGGGRRSW